MCVHIAKIFTQDGTAFVDQKMDGNCKGWLGSL
jgi:hypothetical protein